jgi:hypothetical protein
MKYFIFYSIQIKFNEFVIHFKNRSSNPYIKEFMDDMGFGVDYAKLQDYYEEL